MTQGREWVPESRGTSDVQKESANTESKVKMFKTTQRSANSRCHEIVFGVKGKMKYAKHNHAQINTQTKKAIRSVRGRKIAL